MALLPLQVVVSQVSNNCKSPNALYASKEN